MQCSSEDEMKQMHFDDTLSKRAKLRLVLSPLREKLSSQDAAAATQTLYYVNYAAGDKLLLGIYTMQIQLGHVEKAEKPIRRVVDQRKDKTNLSHLHSLSSLLEQQGKYTEAEDTKVPVMRWLD
jgi:Flp pilus assembly protein TadD